MKNKITKIIDLSYLTIGINKFISFLQNYFSIIFIFIAILSLLINLIIYPFLTQFERTIKIKKKYIRARGRYGDSYLKVDNNNNIYQVNNLVYNLDFNRAEDWNILEPNQTYKIKGYVFRVGFLNMYPTIN